MTGLNVGAVFSMLPRHLLDGCTEKWGEGFVIVEDDLRNKNPVGVGDGNFALDTGSKTTGNLEKQATSARSSRIGRLPEFWPFGCHIGCRRLDRF